jgi:hypothetical protein
MDRNHDWAFFTVLFDTDIWSIIKIFIYPNKKKSNIYDYKNGNIAAYHGYTSLLKFNKQ